MFDVFHETVARSPSLALRASVTAELRVDAESRCNDYSGRESARETDEFP